MDSPISGLVASTAPTAHNVQLAAIKNIARSRFENITRLLIFTVLRLQLDDLRTELCFDDQLGGQQTLSLVLRAVSAVDYIGDELRAERQAAVAAVDVASLL